MHVHFTICDTVYVIVYVTDYITVCVTVCAHRTAVNATSGVKTQLGGVFTGLFFEFINS